MQRLNWKTWPLAAKLALIMTCLVVGAVVSVTWLSNRRTQATFRLELEQQADLLLDALAATTTDPLYYLDADFLANAMQAVGKQHEELVSGHIYDPQGRVIADAHAAGFTIQIDSFGQRLLESDGTVFEWQADQLRAGRAIIVGRQRLGAISVGLPTAPLESKIASVRNEGFLVALIAAVTGALLALLFSQSITKPVQNLVRATERITAGDLTDQISVSSDDELAVLGNAMEQMRVELLSLYQGLEQEVAERTQAMQELAQANQDKETLLYVVSHDLKEPLRAIQNFSRLVNRRYKKQLDSKGQDFLARIERAAQRLRTLIDDILTLSRTQSMEVPSEALASETMVQDVLAQLEGRIQETGALIHLSPDLPPLQVNRTWATQAIYNLVANALKYTREGEAPEVEIASYDGPKGIGLIIKDRGPGIKPEHAERIWGLFERAVGREIEGTGAGLAIVRQIAERHGGHAWMRPRDGGGSEFMITFGSTTDDNDGPHP